LPGSGTSLAGRSSSSSTLETGSRSARFAPTGRLLVTAGHRWDRGSLGHAIRGWKSHKLVGHSNRILDAEFSPVRPPDRSQPARTRTARVWDTRTGYLLGVLTKSPQLCPCGLLSARTGRPSPRRAENRMARIFDPNGTLRATLVGHREPVVDVAFQQGRGVRRNCQRGRHGAALGPGGPQPDLLLLGRQGSLRQEGA